MMSSRETIMAALFAKLQAVTFPSTVNNQITWVVSSRRLKLWSDVAKTQMPAMYLTDHHETPSWSSSNMPEKNSLGADVFIYFDASSPSDVGSTSMNIILDAIDAALSPAPGPGGSAQTLGVPGVAHCRIDGGQILKDPGDIDGQGLLMIPIKILAV